MMFPWIPLACAALHLTEEFAWPGGFIAWYRWYRSDYASAITRPYIVGVNALLIGLTIVIGMLGDGPRGAALCSRSPHCSASTVSGICRRPCAAGATHRAS